MGSKAFNSVDGNNGIVIANLAVSTGFLSDRKHLCHLGLLPPHHRHGNKKTLTTCHQLSCVETAWSNSKEWPETFMIKWIKDG